MGNPRERSASGEDSTPASRGRRRQAAGAAPSPCPRPIVTLLTDFGHQDPFVGIMKGVILGLCPEAVIVDLCHEIPAFDILGGSFLLQSAVRFFPSGTIHVAVVDPGVGGPRRPILARIDQQIFVAPDNGLLSYPMAGGTMQSVRAITASQYLLDPVSATFHGRDVFAPTAGHLARGLSPERLGPEIADVVRLAIPQPQRDGSGAIRGAVLWVDRFGNCITNITTRELGAAAAVSGVKGQIRIDGRPLGPLVGYFGEAEGGRGAIIGSTGQLELFSNLGNLAREWGLTPGASVCLEWEAGAATRGDLQNAGPPGVEGWRSPSGRALPDDVEPGGFGLKCVEPC
ncbi:MAG TPA: SAM-dependent chlorinase/fluorinase [Candidatus Acidoferrum sp.]|nr:SAM-dependent chlorinase/fluorinase [Candidatus Acidoferrum sp.]